MICTYVSRSSSPALPIPPSVSSRRRHALTPPADLIDKATLEIKQDEDETVYKDLQDIADDLPDHSPRFILLSYPVTLVGLPFLSFFPPLLFGRADPSAALRPPLGPIRPPVLSPCHV